MRAEGDRIHRYVVVALLGRGGMGEVYEAEDTVLKRRVALKLIPRRGDLEARERMLREARAAAAFEHPQVVTVFDAGVVDEGLETEETYLAMELVRGKSLRDYIGDKGVSLARRMSWLSQIADALAAAHEAGLVHRDIKPDNVMVRDDGALRVLDFGIAKRQAKPIDASAPTEAPTSSQELTQQGSFIGTPRYAAPEQLRGESVDGRTDQYAFGVTAYELLCGALPFEADSGVTLLARVLSSEPPSLSGKNLEVSPEIEAIVLRCLRKDPDARYASMHDVVSALAPFVLVSTASGRPAALSTTRKPPHVVKRVARGVMIAVLGLATLIGGIILLMLLIGAVTGKLRFNRDGAVSASARPLSTAGIAPKGLRCQAASVENQEDATTLDAIGIGACARLAVEVGLPWGHERARDKGVDLQAFSPLEVVLDGHDPSRVTLRVEGATASGEGASPIEAVQQAVLALAPMIQPPALSEADRASWGAADDASARRIQRTWRKLVIGALDDPENVSRELLLSDGDSPFPHAIFALVTARGSAPARQAATDIMSRLSRLPPARAKALEGIAILMREPTREEEAVKLFRQSYRDAPDDPDVAGLYGAVVLGRSSQEGFAVIERVAEDFPTYAHVPLTNAVTASQTRDAQRNARYLARLAEIQPEKSCQELQFSELILDDQLQELRARLSRCKRLFGDRNGLFMSSLVEAAVEQVALEPEKSRAAAHPLLGDPRESVRAEAVRLTIASYVLGGQLKDALEALRSDAKRLRDQESPLGAVQRIATVMLLQWRLGQPWSQETLKELAELRALDIKAPPSMGYRLDAILARTPKTSKAEASRALEALLASKNPSDALYGLELLRRVKGDREAWAIFSEREAKASYGTRVTVALDVALLLEAIGAEPKLIEERYRLAMVSTNVDVAGFDKVAARLRLAKLLDTQGRTPEAEALRAEVDRAWAHADPGLREIALALR